MSGIKRYDWFEDGMDTQFDGDHVKFADHASEIARLRAEADALRVDAERYRWLIRNWQFDKDSPISLHFDLDGLDDTDKAAAAIDAAMGADT